MVSAWECVEAGGGFGVCVCLVLASSFPLFRFLSFVSSFSFPLICFVGIVDSCFLWTCLCGAVCIVQSVSFILQPRSTLVGIPLSSPRPVCRVYFARLHLLSGVLEGEGYSSRSLLGTMARASFFIGRLDSRAGWFDGLVVPPGIVGKSMCMNMITSDCTVSRV